MFILMPVTRVFERENHVWYISWAIYQLLDGRDVSIFRTWSKLYFLSLLDFLLRLRWYTEKDENGKKHQSDLGPRHVQSSWWEFESIAVVIFKIVYDLLWNVNIDEWFEFYRIWTPKNKQINNELAPHYIQKSSVLKSQIFFSRTKKECCKRNSNTTCGKLN